MRRLLIASFLVVPFAFGQQESETAWDVKYLMEAERYGGRHIKILWWAGDQTAVEMRKLYDDDFLAQPRNLRKVLGILEAAFGNLEQVRYAEDKEPRASISLLRSVQQKVSDPRYKTAIDELIDKLRVPEAIEADSGCIDPLALPMIPISSRNRLRIWHYETSTTSPFGYPMTREGRSSSIFGTATPSRKPLASPSGCREGLE